jgi:hypothetical protein
MLSYFAARMSGNPCRRQSHLPDDPSALGSCRDKAIERGKTGSVKAVEETIPPMTTVARGLLDADLAGSLTLSHLRGDLLSCAQQHRRLIARS